MDWNIKNNKNSALIPQYTHKISDICDITIYYCDFTIRPVENVTFRFFIKIVRWMLRILFLFFFHPPFQDLQRKCP